MSLCSKVTLGTACFLFCALQTVAAEFLFESQTKLSFSDERFGGLSAIEMLDGGTKFVTLTDRAVLFHGQVVRKSGAVSQVTVESARGLKNGHGEILKGWKSNSEGLAFDPRGRLHVSFEGDHKILQYQALDGRATRLPDVPNYASLQNNSSLESLAIDGRGRIYTLPERSGKLDRPFPLYRFEKGQWTTFSTIPRRDKFLPVAADFGPDGKFYLLERQHFAPLRFQSRIRRFAVSEAGLTHEEVVLVTRVGQFGNLEGLSVWRDQAGKTRASTVSDDNFLFLLSSTLVEFTLSE
ncbi:MAG: esterase-like activity of phytase family protein [Halocynthiibacter sp.]